MFKNIICISLFALTSCAFHSGNISTGSYIDCPYSHVIKGKASTTKLFGLGGLSKNALIADAKSAMYLGNATYKGEKISNFVVDFKTTYILFYTKKEVTVSADVFNCDKQIQDNSTVSNLTENKVNNIVNGLTIGDSVLVNKTPLIIGIITKHVNSRKVEVTYLSAPENVSKSSLFYYPEVFKTSKNRQNKNYFGYEIGEIVNADIFSKSKQTYISTKCIVKAVNTKYLAVQELDTDKQQNIIYFENKKIKD